MSAANTPSRPSSTASKCGPTRASAWPNPSRPRCAWVGSGARSRTWTIPSGPNSYFPTNSPAPFAITRSERARAAPVFLQQSDRRLSELRRSRHTGVFRPRKNRRQSAFVARGRCGARLGSAQCLLFPADPILARHTKFDIEAPFESLPQRIKDLVLFGSDDEQIEFKYLDGKGGTLKRKHTFEGIVKNLERRYKETESATVREELRSTALHAPAPSAVARGSTKRRATSSSTARTLPEVSRSAVERAIEFFSKLTLPGWRGRGRRQDRQGDRRSLGFLGQRGLGLSDARSQRRHACPAARRSASASRARSARDWSASCTSSMSPPSVCTSATTQRLLDTLVACAISAIR
jgi:hypothetical protein